MYGKPHGASKGRLRFGIAHHALEAAKDAFNRRRKKRVGASIKIYAWSANQWLDALESPRSYKDIGKQLGIHQDTVRYVLLTHFPFARPQKIRRQYRDAGWQKSVTKRRERNERQILGRYPLPLITAHLESAGLPVSLVRDSKSTRKVMSRYIRAGGYLGLVFTPAPFRQRWGVRYISVQPFQNGRPDPLPDFLLIFAEIQTKKGLLRRFYTIPTGVFLTSGLAYIQIRLRGRSFYGRKAAVGWSRFAGERGLVALKALLKTPR